MRPADAAAAGKYRVEREVSRSAFSTIYLATQLALQRPVTIKAIAAQRAVRAEELEERAADLGRLKHPHVIEVYDSWTTELNELFVVMEHLDGVRLSDAIGQSGLEIGEVVQLACQICAGVRQAHLQDIVHGYLTSSSVVLRDHGANDGLHAKVVDFGLAEMAPAGRSGSVYRAPEQLRRQAPDARSDVYALGVMLYEMSTGLCPPEGTPRRSARAANDERFDWTGWRRSATGQAELEVVVRRCLWPDPDLRYAHAGELLSDLEAVAELILLAEQPRGPSAGSVGPTADGAAIAALFGGVPVEGRRERFFRPDAWPWPMAAVLAMVMVTSSALWWLLLGP